MTGARPTPSLARRIVRRLKRVLQRVAGTPPAPPPAQPKKNKHLWSIGLYAGPSPLALTPRAGVTNPVMTREQVTDVRAALVADPFLVRDGATTHMFFEVLNIENGRGEIGLASSTDLATWDYRGIVLREPHHLSYPHVFAWEGTYYMVPESHATGSVELYRATDFPMRWERVDTLLTGAPFSDSTLVHHDGRWWLFSETGAPFQNDTLRLYVADALRGPWAEHPRSPIVAGDKHTARPGGRVVQHDGRLLRFAQDCVPHYGVQVLAFEITELTPTSYAERAVELTPPLNGSGAGWNAAGMHHVDAHRVGADEWIAAVDGWRWATMNEVMRR